VASGNATAAKDTLVVIANDSGAVILDLKLVGTAAEARGVNAVFAAELLKLTVRGANAGEAALIVCRKNKLKVHLSCTTDLLGVRFDLHALIDGVNAGGNKTACANDFDKAETASTDLINIFKVAKRRNVHACNSRGFENGCVFRNLIFSAVDLYFYHIHF
jgi:hypothetical protein